MSHSMPESSPALHRSNWASMPVLLLVLLLSGVYTGVGLRHGWGFYDEGTLGQSAERILQGELPHRDFHDVYTGGLAYLDALVFRVAGTNLLALRLFLFAAFLMWVPAVYALAAEFTGPWPAGLVTLLAVSWSIPNYSTPIPSWYSLILATFGTLALAKYIREPAPYLLILAGLAGGFSFLIKSVALYYVGGAVLFFVFREQSLSGNPGEERRKTPLYTVFQILCLAALVLALFRLVAGAGESSRYLHFVFPGFAIALLLIARERNGSTVISSLRFKTLFTMAAPFLVAFLVPVAAFFAFYAYHHALPALLNGLFTAPFRRVLYARQDPAPLVFEYPAVIAALLILETAKLRGLPRRVLSIFLVVAAALVLFTSRRLDTSYIIALRSAALVIPVLVAAAIIVLFRDRPDSQSELQRDQLLALLLAMTALFSLIQFPYAALGYFYYVAPLAILLAANLAARFAQPPRLVLAGAAAFYVLFAVLIIRPGYIGARYGPYIKDSPLLFRQTPGILATKETAAELNQLIPFVQQLAGSDGLLAGPDCPEIYFLSGIRNPTPFLFEFAEDPEIYTQLVNSLLQRPGLIRAVVINNRPDFSKPTLETLQTLIAGKFPQSRKIGNFTVYWRP